MKKVRLKNSVLSVSPWLILYHRDTNDTEINDLFLSTISSMFLKSHTKQELPKSTK